jgi:hypothetical protein
MGNYTSTHPCKLAKVLLINATKVQELLSQEKVKNLLVAIAALDDTEDQLKLAQKVMQELSEIEAAVVYVEHEGSPNMQQFGYITTRVSEDFMFEVAYLQSVLGTAPYQQAIEFGLSQYRRVPAAMARSRN